MTGSTGLSRRGFLQATGGAAAAVSLAGCIGGNDDGDSNDTTGTPQKGGRLNLIMSGTIDTFDPVAASDTASGEVITQVFDPLINYPNGEVGTETLLAKEFKTNGDNTVYTFTLKDATFHNGDSVTAKDVVYSFERLAGSPHSVRSDFILNSLGVTHETDSNGNYKPDTLGVTAKDEKTVEITLERPFHSTLELLAYASFAIVPSGIVGSFKDEGTHDSPSDQYTKFADTNPIGAGPFKFDHWSKQDEAEVVRFENYHGQVPHLEGVYWKVLEDDSAAFNRAMGGNADMFELPTAKYNPGKVKVENTDDKQRKTGTYGPIQGETLDYQMTPLVSTRYIAFNGSNVPKPVRQAVAYIFNQQSLYENVLKKRHTPGYHLTPKLIYPGGKKAYNSHAKNKYPYGYKKSDVESAKKVMQKAGYGKNNRFKLEFTHYESTVYKQLAKNLRQQLKPAFIDMSINQAKFQTLIQRGENGKNQLFSLGWVADWPAPDSFLKLLYPPNTHSGDPSSFTYLDWGRDKPTPASKKAAKNFEKVQNNLQPTKKAKKAREDAYIKMEEASWEDAILIPTHHDNQELFSYQDTQLKKVGGMERSRNKYNNAWKEQ